MNEPKLDIEKVDKLIDSMKEARIKAEKKEAEEEKKEKKKTTVIIKITDDHLKRGMRNNIVFNPIALAVNEKFKELNLNNSFVTVGDDEMILHRKRGKKVFIEERVELSHVLKFWNGNYNAAKQADPIEFDVLELHARKLVKPPPPKPKRDPKAKPKRKK